MKKSWLLCLLLLASFATRAQTLLNESFNTTGRTTTPPAGWTVSGTGTNDNACSPSVVWEQVPSGGFFCSGTPNPAAHSGSGMAGYNSWDIYNGGKSELVSPALNFSGYGTTTLNVWVWDSLALYFGSPNPQYDSLAIYVNTSPTSSGGTMLYRGTPSYDYSGTGWTLFSFSIPTTYSGTTNYIIFRAASLYGNDIFFDDVTVIRNPPTPCNGTPLTPTITNTAMSATSPLCSGSSVTLNAIDPNYPTIGGIAFQWETSSSATGPWTSVTGGTGATTLSYNTGLLTTSAYYRMSATCSAAGVPVYTNPYFVIVGAPQPGAITGNASFCPGDVSTYSVPNVAGTTYTWTLPAGWGGISTTNAISVTPSSTPGTISVTATSLCGTSIPQNKAVVAGSAPATPASVTGSSTACLYSSQTYGVATVAGATSYSWSVPSGWSISNTTNGGQTITATTGTTGGNIVVTAINGCGTSSQTLAVAVITSLPSPGTITGPNTPCAGALYTYSINAVPGATSYIWTLPNSGWAGTTTGTSIQVFAGTTGGPLSVTAYSACSTSPTTSITTTVSPSVTPTVSLSTSSSPICQGTATMFVATSTNGGPAPVYIWQKNGNVVLATGNTYVDYTLVNGDVLRTILVSNALCRTADSTPTAAFTVNVTPMTVPGININSTPITTMCSGTMVNLTTTITGGGTSPTYQWYSNNNPILSATGPTFSSSAINNNDTITVKLTTNAICPSMLSTFSNKVGFKVNDLVVPSITASASSTTPMPGLPITFTATESGGGPTPSYQWIVNSVDVPGETGSTFTSSSLQAGDHIAVLMISYDPCAMPRVVTSKEIVLDNPLSVKAVSGWDGLVSLYPNPTSGRFTISAETNSVHTGRRTSIDVLNVVGQNTYHNEVMPEKSQWHYDVQLNEGLPNGHYTLRISTDDGMRATIPFILNR